MARSSSASTRPPRRSGARTSSRPCSTSSPRTPRSGRTRCSSSTTTRTAASSTTCRRRRRPGGTPGEYLTVNPLPAAAGGIVGPVGLGFRVPCILMSPFTRGGYLATRRLRPHLDPALLETRFGVAAPNLSAWRRSTVGDLTSALALGTGATECQPVLPAASLTVPRRRRGGHRQRARRAPSTRASPTRRRPRTSMPAQEATHAAPRAGPTSMRAFREPSGLSPEPAPETRSCLPSPAPGPPVPERRRQGGPETSGSGGRTRTG